MKPIVYYTDPGHGWVAVKRAHLIALGIENQVSQFSYQRGATVYLEEDCDASLYFAALKREGIVPQCVEKHTDRYHQIRSYESFKPVTL